MTLSPARSVSRRRTRIALGAAAVVAAPALALLAGPTASADTWQVGPVVQHEWRGTDAKHDCVAYQILVRTSFVQFPVAPCHENAAGDWNLIEGDWTDWGLWYRPTPVAPPAPEK